jgi:hypothetical protein
MGATYLTGSFPQNTLPTGGIESHSAFSSIYSRVNMANRFDEQVVRDEMLETLSGGRDELSIDDWMESVDQQIHAFDPNGPRLPPKPWGLGDLVEFSGKSQQWAIKHPDFRFDPRILPA